MEEVLILRNYVVDEISSSGGGLRLPESYTLFFQRH